MSKRLILIFMVLALFLLASCACKKETVAVKTTETKPAVTTGEIPATGEAPVDAVAEDISDAGNVDEELDTTELEDVDNLLADIENI